MLLVVALLLLGWHTVSGSAGSHLCCAFPLPFEMGEESLKPAKLLVCMQQRWWGGLGGDCVCMFVIVASKLLCLLLEVHLSMSCGLESLPAGQLCVLEDGFFIAASPKVQVLFMVPLG